MRPAEKLSITLPADMARMVRDKVEGGSYASNSEVIREALRIWQEREAVKLQRLDEIRAKIAASLDDQRPSLTARSQQASQDAAQEDSESTRSWHVSSSIGGCRRGP
jgi:antitoxin ParD1/3/4